MPPHVIPNCFRHSGFIRSEPKDAAVAEEVLAESSNDECLSFDAVLPIDVTLANNIAINYSVATASQLTNKVIVNNVTRSQDYHNSIEDRPCEKEQPRPHRTSREATEAL